MALTPEDLAAIRRELEAVLDRRLGRDTLTAPNAPSPRRKEPTKCDDETPTLGSEKLKNTEDDSASAWDADAELQIARAMGRGKKPRGNGRGSSRS